jgi:homoserine O-acetyltransferase
MTASGPRTLYVPRFTLEDGTVVADAPVAYRTWGTPGPVCTLVCHALTGDANALDWWAGLVGPGKALDPAERFIVCCNAVGSPYGTLSPLTIDPSTGQPYGAAFPVATIRDTVRLHRHVLDALGVERVELAIGGSMGGMQVLEWALLDERIEAIAPIAVGARQEAWAIGWGEAERQAIGADPAWNEGAYPPHAPPTSGLAVARMIAMLSYRAPQGFALRHGRNRMPGSDVFSAASYLRYQGDKFVGRFDPLCYVRLTQQMDTHDVARGRGELRDVLGQIAQPAWVATIDTDGLYPPSEQHLLADALPRAMLAPITSPHGHDAFLIEFDQMASQLGAWLAELRR